MKTWKLITAVAMLAALALPGVGMADGHGAGCEDPFAKILQPDGGQVIVNGIVVQSGTGQQLSLSTTGTIDVVIEHDCAIMVDLKVTKTGPGAPTVIHQNSWSPLPCDHGQLTDTVSIGLDGGTYQFDLTGMACTGRKFRSDGHGGTILDPPLGQIL